MDILLKIRHAGVQLTHSFDLYSHKALPLFVEAH